MIYTPNLEAPGYTDDRLIAVDLENNVTRVLNSDYFGESKKGGLRMWNSIVFGKGGLALHAGLKVIPTDGGDKVFMIIGLSGTGKTTTTFTTQNGSRPIQDDFVGADAGRQGLRHRERVLREDVRAEPRLRAVDPRRRREAHHVPRERLPGRRRHGRLQQRALHAERPRGVRHERPAELTRTRATSVPSTTLLILNRNENIIPGRGEAEPGAGGRVLHARRDHRHGGRGRQRGRQVPARARHQPVLPVAPRPSRATGCSSCSPRTRSRRSC